MAQVKRLCQWAERQVVELEQDKEQTQAPAAVSTAAAAARADRRCRCRFVSPLPVEPVPRPKSGVGPVSIGTGGITQGGSACRSLAFDCARDVALQRLLYSPRSVCH